MESGIMPKKFPTPIAGSRTFPLEKPIRSKAL